MPQRMKTSDKVSSDKELRGLGRMAEDD
jgi:hypothetical protein